MKYGNLTLGQIEAIVNKLGGMDGVSRFLVGEMIVQVAQPPHPKTIRERYPNSRIIWSGDLELDYTKSPLDTLLATVIDEKCDSVYEWMKSCCPQWKGSGRITVKGNLINMGLDWPRKDAIEIIPTFDLIVPQDNCALWTLSRRFPDLQRKNWIVDPGTVWTDGHGDSCVACLGGASDYRGADLDGIAGGWRRHGLVFALSK